MPVKKIKEFLDSQGIKVCNLGAHRQVSISVASVIKSNQLNQTLESKPLASQFL